MRLPLTKLLLLQPRRANSSDHHQGRHHRLYPRCLLLCWSHLCVYPPPPPSLCTYVYIWWYVRCFVLCLSCIYFSHYLPSCTSLSSRCCSSLWARHIYIHKCQRIYLHIFTCVYKSLLLPVASVHPTCTKKNITSYLLCAGVANAGRTTDLN
jgi:hypothetical protein